MTNLTLQSYSTKLAKHQPPDLRNPTEKDESAGLQKKEKKEREEVTCFKLCNPRPQVTLHKKTGLVPEGRPEERERAVLTSRWSALECPVLARIARDIPTLTNRAQLSHVTNVPIVTANRRVGEGKRGASNIKTPPPPLTRTS